MPPGIKWNDELERWEPNYQPGEQRIRLLGPFHIDHTSNDLTLDGVVLAAIEEGQRVIRVWAEIGEDDPFVAVEGQTPFRLMVGLRDSSDPGNTLALVRYDEPNISDNFTDYFVRTENSGQVGAPAVATAVASCDLIAKLTIDPGPATGNDLTAGTADIYALIAEPAES
jgi:hypothetical protein